MASINSSLVGKCNLYKEEKILILPPGKVYLKKQFAFVVHEHSPCFYI